MTKFLVPNYIYKAAEIEREIYKTGVTEEDVSFFERMYYENVKFYPDEVKSPETRFNLGKRIGYHYLDDMRHKHNKFADPGVTRSGEKYFDWMFLPERLNKSSAPLMICAGAGINVSFEIDLAARYPDGRIYILDPSPQSVKHFSNTVFPANVTFEPLGLGKKDEVVRFYRPEKGGSLSIHRLNPGDVYDELPLARVETFCKERGLDPHAIDLLKFDIEGAEHDVLDDLAATELFPDQILCEFDQPIPPWTIEAAILKLIGRGYRVAAIWDLNVLFVRED